MSYYLKYRPQTIEELDLSRVRQRLKQVLASKEPVQAWLLAGPKGTGKTSTARIIAKTVNCLEKTAASSEPCGRCPNCKAIQQGKTMDVLEIDAASNRGIDNIRELKERVGLAPASLNYKVYIIDEVHMLTREAFNALLKTLEEPPAHAVFILATTEPEKLPETIVSRCLVLSFTPASAEELRRALTRVIKGEKLTVKPKQLEEVIVAASGSFRDAVKLLEHPDNLPVLNLDDWLVLVYRRQAASALAWLEQAWARGVQPNQLLLQAIERLRQAWLFAEKIGGRELVGVNDSRLLKELMRLLLAAEPEVKAAAIAGLPLELAVVEWCRQQQSTTEIKTVSAEVGVSASTDQQKKWQQVLTAVRPLNHSLEALLKAAEPIGFKTGFLEIKVFYPFHKEKLEEERYRLLVEKAATQVWGKKVKIRYFLGQKQPDIIKTAEEIFGVS